MTSVSDIQPKDNSLRFSESCKNNFGVSFEDLMQDIIFKAINAMPCNIPIENRLQAAVKSVLEMKPKDPIEAKLLAKETAIYSLAMQYVARAEKGMFSDESNESSCMWYETNMNFAIKLLRLHNETVETLGRYRRNGEQRVNVTHSVVAGQAIVNNFVRIEGYPKKIRKKLMETMKLCGARSKTNHHLPCRLKALPSGRCRFHGGLSTGPKEAGRQRLAKLKTKHGYWSKNAITERKLAKKFIQK
jgi:hypothetical protein